MRVANETDIGARSESHKPGRPVAVHRGPAPSLPRTSDERAFQRAVSQHCATLRASALRLTRNRSDAEDLLQNTLLRAWRYWPRYQERENCRAWLQRIMLNAFCSDRRSCARRRKLIASYALAQCAAADVACSGAVAGTDPHRRVSHEELAQSLATLKPEQARILRLVDMDERSYREAAAELACPVGTVMSRLHRARTALRGRLTSQAEAYA